MQHYYAVAEPDEVGGFWEIVGQAPRRAGIAAEVSAGLPPSLEDGAKPPADLSDHDPRSIVVVILFASATTAKAAE
jgi:hypothetical protein